MPIQHLFIAGKMWPSEYQGLASHISYFSIGKGKMIDQKCSFGREMNRGNKEPARRGRGRNSVCREPEATFGNLSPE